MGDEKRNRAMEILVTSVSPTELVAEMETDGRRKGKPCHRNIGDLSLPDRTGGGNGNQWEKKDKTVPWRFW